MNRHITLDELETVGRPFRAMFRTRCRANDDHVIRPQEKVSKVQFAANPFIPISGVVCSRCWISLPAAVTEEEE